MEDPGRPSPPGARGAGRLAGAAALLFAAGFLLGHRLPAGGGEGTAGPPPRPAAGPPPKAPDLPALRAENAALRAAVAALERAPPPPGATGLPAAPPSPPVPPPLPPSPRTAGLRVRVVDGAGAPVAGARARTLVFRESRPEDEERAETNAWGIADFAGLPPGPRRVSVLADGLSLDCDPCLEAGRVLEVVFPVEGGVPVSGTVRHAERGPIPGAGVSLFLNEGPFRRSLQAGADLEGRYRFPSVPPGPWTVWVGGEGVGKPLQVGLLLVPEGVPLARDLVLGVCRLSGTVRDGSTGAPIPGARVVATGWGGDRTAESDGAGTYRLLDLPAGPHRLFAGKDGFGSRSLEAVEVPEEGLRLDVELAPAAALALVVTRAAGGPFAGNLVVSALPKDPGSGTRASVTVPIDEAGRGNLRAIVPGAYTLRFRARGGGEAADLEVEVPPGPSTLEVRLQGKR